MSVSRALTAMSSLHSIVSAAVVCEPSTPTVIVAARSQKPRFRDVFKHASVSRPIKRETLINDATTPVRFHLLTVPAKLKQRPKSNIDEGFFKLNIG